MTARSIPRMACNARRLSLGASGGVYALPGAYGNLAAGPNTWQCASHAAGGNVNRGCGTAKDCRIRPRMPSTELPGERALEARTMRRVAVRVVPFLMVCYFVSFLDRVNLGFAALQMVRDLHFSATVFGIGGGIFFVSYFLFEAPCNLALERVGARRWIARIMITWGLVVLSDGPAAASWLADDERRWLLRRLEAEERRPRRVGHMRLSRVLWNKHVLVLSLVLAGSTAVSSGLQLWQPQIIKSYGLTNMQTGLLNAIPFALASVIMIWWGRRSDRTGERIWHASAPLILTAVSLASALLFDSLFSIVVTLCLAVIGIYAGKGPVWAVSTEWLSGSTAAAGLAQINAISNLAGFVTTYAIGFIKDATGSFSLALVPLVVLAASAAVAILLIGRSEASIP